MRDTIDLGDGHRIEIGEATWDSSQTSVRNHHPSANGGCGPHSSSEIPLADIGPIVASVAERDLLDVATTARLLEALAASVKRRAGSPVPSSLDELLDRVTDENRHAEVETGPAVGNEAW